MSDKKIELFLSHSVKNSSTIILTLLVAISASSSLKADSKPGGRAKPQTLLNQPTNYRLPRPRKLLFTGSKESLLLFAREFQSGDAVYLELLPKNGKSFSSALRAQVTHNQKPVPLTRRSWGFRGIFALPPDSKKNKSEIKVVLSLHGVREVSHYSFPVKIRKFRVSKSSLNLGSYSDREKLKKNPAFLEEINKNRQKKNSVFKRQSPDYLTDLLSHPRDFHKITSPYFAQRVISRYVIREGKKVFQKPQIKTHRGTDFKGKRGDRIFAIASGRAVIAEPMYYEGNHTLIDHGLGIFSSYMHQHKVFISEGDFIKSGQLIGEVGDTGRVTGPHLHLALYIRTVPVSVLSFLALPIRK